MDAIELKAALEDLKKGLETSLEEKSAVKIKAADDKMIAVEKAFKDLEDLQAKKETATEAEFKAIKADLDATVKALDILQVRIKNAPVQTEVKAQNFNTRLAEAMENATDQIEKFKRKEVKSFELELKAVGPVTTASVSGPTNWGAINQGGIIMNPNRKTHIRSLIDVLPAGPGTDYYFMRENGVGEGAIAPVAEGTLKPQFDIDLVEASVPFQVIAGWLLMSRKALANVPGMTSFLQKRLPELLLNAEDAQILYGNGTTPNISGILNTGNFQASTAAANQKLVEKIITDMAVLEDTYQRMATGILLRPIDFYSFFTNKATGSGEYDLPDGVTFVNGQLLFLGVPVSTTTALTGTDYVVGDFQNGTDLMQQEAMRIEFFEQDSDNVRKNLITVRVEETVALPVYGSDYFIKGVKTYTP